MAIVPNLNGVPISPVTPLYDPHNPTTEELERDVYEQQLAEGAFGAQLIDTATAAAAKTLLAIATGDVSGLAAALATKADTVHTHVAADVISGVFNIARIPAIPVANVTGISAFAQTLLDDADVAALLVTLGLTQLTNTEAWTGADTSKVLTALRLFSINAPVAVAYAASITLDMNTGLCFDIGTLTGNLTLANPTNVIAGKGGRIRLEQDATGNRTLTLGSNFKKPAGFLISTGANKVDLVSWYARTTTEIELSLGKDYS